MPSCQLCNKALAEDTLDSLCEHCRKQKENPLTEEPTGKPFRTKKILRFFLPSLTSVIALILVFGLQYTFEHIIPRKYIPIAEQTVIAAVQSETGKTPLVSSQVAGHYVSTIIAVRYAFTEEELKNETCPTYYVIVSGSSAELMLVEEPTVH